MFVRPDIDLGGSGLELCMLVSMGWWSRLIDQKAQTLPCTSVCPWIGDSDKSYGPNS